MDIAEYFNYKCPYTGKECWSWNCSECPIEEQERAFMSEEDEDDNPPFQI